MNEEEIIDVTCPFCKEEEFDLIGLKHHITQGHCEKFNETENITDSFLEKLIVGEIIKADQSS